MYSGNTLWGSDRARLVVAIAIGASFVATAQPAPPPTPVAAPAATAASSVQPKTGPSFRGSAVTYGHSATAYTFSRSALPMYNPTESHHLGIAPEFHFNDQFFVRGAFTLTQELTQHPDGTWPYEVQISDIVLALGATGFQEKVTGLRLGGSVQVGLPTSKASHAQTRLLALGPALTLSRTFPVLSGLTLAYSGRYSYRFHKFTTAQFDAPGIQGCGSECGELISTGRRNAHSDLTHGPTVTFAPIEPVSLAASFAMTTQWLYPVAKDPSVTANGPFVSNRYYLDFDVSVSWQIFRPIGVSLGANASAPQLSSMGRYDSQQYFLNTSLYLDLARDVEAAVSGILGDRS